MTTILPWLPTSALEPAHFEQALSRVIEEWSNHWLAKAKASCRVKARGLGINEAQRAARSWGNECCVSLDEAGRLALAEAMLDKPIAANSVLPADRPLLIDITNRCLDDLLGRMSWLIDHDRAPQIEGRAPQEGHGICWEVGLKRSGAAINLTVYRSALVRWRKALAPHSEPPSLASVAQALTGQLVRIDLHAGRSALSLAELENLADGDVVILDRLVEGSLELMAAGRPTGMAGKLTHQEDTLTIDIVEKKKVAK